MLTRALGHQITAKFIADYYCKPLYFPALPSHIEGSLDPDLVPSNRHHRTPKLEYFTFAITSHLKSQPELGCVILDDTYSFGVSFDLIKLFAKHHRRPIAFIFTTGKESQILRFSNSGLCDGNLEHGKIYCCIRGDEFTADPLSGRMKKLRRFLEEEERASLVKWSVTNTKKAASKASKKYKNTPKK
jgi:hypothetical protein